MSHARARLAVALAGRRPLVPLTALGFTSIGVFAYRPNDVAGSWAVTSLLAFALAAWLVAAIEREVPEPTEAMFAVAAGGPRAAWRGRLVVVGLVAASVSVVFLAYPVASGAFDPPPDAGDLAAAALLHLGSGCAGGALALVLAPPLRPATAFAVILTTLIATVALGRPLGPLAGPGGAADAFADATRERIPALLLAVAVTLLQAACLVQLARALARRRG